MMNRNNINNIFYTFIEHLSCARHFLYFRFHKEKSEVALIPNFQVNNQRYRNVK